jgi:adenine C2-methylase RlmN of 23S rRNA A2503 and tRNA A37
MTVVEKRIRQECFLNQEFMIESMLSLEINLVHLPVVYRHFLVNGREDFETIHNIPHKLLQLIESIPLLSSRLVSLEESNDKSTTKLLIEMQDKTRIETVIMRYGDVALDSFEKLALNPRDQSEYTFKSNKRATVCVSSQVGCAMGCTFCGIFRVNDSNWNNEFAGKFV